MLGLEVNAIEIAARTAIVYGALLFALRVGGKREMGQMTPFDLVVILLVSEAVQNAMVGGDMSVTGGLIAVFVLLVANHVVAAAKDRVPAVRTLLESQPTVLVRDGRLLRKNMEREGITEDELMAAVRHQGVESARDVRLAVLEPSGAISVVEQDQPGKGPG